MPTFDAAAVNCQVSVFREGLLTSMGHDVTFQVTNLSLDVGDDDGITVDLDAVALRVTTQAVKESDRKDIEKNTEKTLEVRKHPKIQRPKDPNSAAVFGAWVVGYCFTPPPAANFPIPDKPPA